MNDDNKSTFKITFDGIGEHNLFETWSESNQNKNHITDYGEGEQVPCRPNS